MDNGPWRTVIGVAGDVRRASIEPVASSAQVYHLAGRTYEAGVGMSVERASILVADRHLAVRLADAPPSREVLVAAIHRVDPSVVVRRIRSADDIVAGEASRSRLVFFLMTGFALFALAIAAAGLFGLLSSLVDHRRREIGIRLALGARPGGIARRLVAHALLLTTGGVIAGMLGSMGLVRFLRAELYGVEPSDPVAIIAACALLVTTASLAAWWPAARAMRIDPAALLRSE
jgi:ABC-type antimicrobial peptide transport system permease subunit